MHIEDRKAIELGVASTDTRGSMMGFSDSEAGLTWRPGLYDD